VFSFCSNSFGGVDFTVGFDAVQQDLLSNKNLTTNKIKTPIIALIDDTVFRPHQQLVLCLLWIHDECCDA